MKLILVFALLTAPILAAPHARDFAVVVNPANPATNVSLGELRKIFHGDERSWKSGAPVRIITRAVSTEEHDELLKILNLSEEDYEKYWSTKSGEGEAPITLPSIGMEREAVSAYPGAIAVVDASQIKPGEKVLRIDGHLPGERNYPLH